MKQELVASETAPLISSSAGPSAETAPRKLAGDADLMQKRAFDLEAKLAQRLEQASSDGTSTSAREEAPERPSLQLQKIGGCMTELLVINAREPNLLVVVIPGNPGVVPYYEEYVMALFKKLGGTASVTCISNAGHTEQDWDNGHLFSIQEQVEHKAAYMESLLPRKLPVVVAGHSIGAHIALEMLRRFPDMVKHVIGLYPFLQKNGDSLQQRFLSALVHASPLRFGAAAFAGGVGRFLPAFASQNVVRQLLGRGWDPPAVATTTKYMLRYGMVQQFTFMGRTEFDAFMELKEVDWELLRTHQDRVSLLFGVDDHWGPLSLLSEVETKLPGVATLVEREGHLHAFCCTIEGSRYVARQTALFLRTTITSKSKL